MLIASVKATEEAMLVSTVKLITSIVKQCQCIAVAFEYASLNTPDERVIAVGLY